MLRHAMQCGVMLCYTMQAGLCEDAGDYPIHYHTLPYTTIHCTTIRYIQCTTLQYKYKYNASSRSPDSAAFNVRQGRDESMPSYRRPPWHHIIDPPSSKMACDETCGKSSESSEDVRSTQASSDKDSSSPLLIKTVFAVISEDMIR